MRKIKKISLLFVFLGLSLIAASAVYIRKFPLTPLNDTVSSATLYFSSVRELIVISGTLPIEIRLSDDDSCVVSYTSALPLVTDMDELGTLRLTQDDSFSLTLLSRRQQDFRLTVTLPRRSYRRISLSSSSGSIDCAPVSCELLEISTRSGNISVRGTDDRAKIRTESGTLELSLNALNDDMEITAGSGNVKLTVPDSLSFCLRFLTESGCLSERGSGRETRRGDAAILKNGAEYLLTVNTTSGSAELICSDPFQMIQ